MPKSAVEMINDGEKELPDAPAILDGFEFVPSDAVPVITLDKQRRFYLSVSARQLMDVAPYDRLALAYNSSTKSLAIVLNSDASLTTSNYNVDKRHYMSARRFADEYNYPSEDAPYTFIYDRASSDGSIFIFRLNERN